MADQTHVFDLAVGHFNSESEDIRSAAAFAAGAHIDRKAYSH